MSNSHVIPIVMENGTSAYVPPAHRKPEHIATFEPSGSYIHRLRPEHIEMLEQQFTKAKTLHNTDLELLAAEMGLNEKDVQNLYKRPLFDLWLHLTPKFVTLNGLPADLLYDRDLKNLIDDFKVITVDDLGSDVNLRLRLEATCIVPFRETWYSDRLSLWRKEQGLADAFGQ